MSPLLKKNDTIVFFGDSVTDCKHLELAEYEGIGNFDGLGFGYVMLISSWLKGLMPDASYRIINSGIGGNRIYDLEARFDRDVLQHKPDWVSFLVGINDTWRRYDSNTESSLAYFSKSYRNMLEPLKKNGTKIIICEPFLLNVPADRAAWREDLDPRIACIREIAQEYNALYIPLDGMFAQAAAIQPAATWLPDGVHPSLAGHALIAQAWLKTVKAI